MATLIIWDWKDAPDWREVNEALGRAKVKKIFPVRETYTDAFAAVVGVRSTLEAQREYERVMDIPREYRS